MEYNIISMMTLAIMMNFCHKIDARLNMIPRNTEVMVNDSTFLNCSTSLQADQVQWRHGSNYVFTGIAVLEPYTSRFSVEIDASTGACNLVIRSVQPSDAGTYACTEDEGFGEERTAQLIILDDDPICKSNMHPNGVIGPNSCGIEPEEVELSCSIKYHGNSLPVLQWKASGGIQCISDGRFKVTWSNNEVTYTLTMNSSLGLNNSSFICQTTRTTDKRYSCSSDAINILYVFTSEVTVNMTRNDEVSCFANTSQSCSYKWKWFNGEDVSIESGNQILKPKKVGWHRCEASCLIRDVLCTVQSKSATVYSEEGQNLMPLLALLLVPAFAFIGVMLYFWRKRNVESRRLEEIELQRREEEERQKLLGFEFDKYFKSPPCLIATIRTKATEEKYKSINGFTILDNELFVVSDKCSEVEVYDSTNFSFSRQWTLKELIDPLDIVSCHVNKYLYISDRKDSGLSKQIFRVDPIGKLLKKWSTKNDCGRLSVTYESNVVLVVIHHNKLNEYSPDGQFIREIHLSSDEGFRYPWHAIKLTNGHLVVSHGIDDNDDDLHRVCIVDADGKLMKSFGGKRGSTIGQVHEPTHLSVDGSGSVMVADHFNSRLLLLDSNLEFKKEIITEEHGLRAPNRIFLDESNGLLFVSDYGQNIPDYRILIFDLRQTRNVTLNS